MKATFDQHIGIFENAVPKEFCNKIIDLFNSNQNHQYSRQETENNIPLYLKTDTQFFKSNKDLEKFFSIFSTNFWNNIFPIYESKYIVDPDRLPKYITDFKLQKTLPSEGYHMWHSEHCNPFPRRIMVYSIYLNDVKEGGETEFLYQSLRVKPKQGTIVVWPAGYTHIHRGNPPLSGEKYIATGWIEWTPPKDISTNE